MDIQKYIESGVLEAYCLGLLSEQDEAYLIQVSMLYPEIKSELAAVELVLEKMAELTAVEPNLAIKQKILASIGFDESSILNLDDLPVITEGMPYQPWLKALAHLIPDDPKEDFICHVLREDKIAQQMLITGNTNVPEEEHGDFYESLFVLRGRCECTIGEQLFALGEGDFVEIPLNTPHDIKLVTPYVTAVLQYRFV
jgi:mannose-6-phosphate isomerase-like protein (cupin superfamily)